MRYLTTVDTITKKTPIDIYVEKQTAWAEAQNDWDRAKIQAQRMFRPHVLYRMIPELIKQMMPRRSFPEILSSSVQPTMIGIKPTFAR